MKNIGVVVAVEIKAVLSRYAGKYTEEARGAFRVYTVEKDDFRFHFVHSEAGEIRTAAAVQMLVDLYSIELLVNFGVVGALTKELSSARTCIVSRVVHYDFDTSAADNCEVGRYLDYPTIYLPTTAEIVKKAHEILPDLPIVTAASGDKFIASAEAKQKLHDQFGADICDMESAAIVLVSDIHHIPNLIIKTVADSVTGGAAEFRERFAKTSELALNAVEKIFGQI